ncbi:hypothetical protein WP50_23895 [Lactiplantibacillus plantarum]|nr:hypothetical protein WP50_23895 [Lactiplantibacillus plantarum]
MGIFGLLYSAIVITGLHQNFPASETQLLANVVKTGGSFIFPVASMANIGQGAATLAIFFATKSQKQKALTSSAGVSALLGITEPAIFGVNLKMKFPFVFAAIASGIASAVLNAIGKNNIQAAAHCATRLRLVIKDESKIDQQALDDDADVKGTFETNGQYQIIIGPGDVDKVYDALIAKTGLKEATPDDIKAVAAAGQKKNPLMDFLKVLSDIFIPIVPALVAGGLLMALNNVLTAEHLFMAKSVVEVYPGLKGIAEMINAMASAPFTFLPILLGFSATKRFGGNPYLGATMGMIMVLPSLVNGYSVATTMAAGKMVYWNVFGLHVAQAGYQGQVLPVLRDG